MSIDDVGSIDVDKDFEETVRQLIQENKEQLDKLANENCEKSSELEVAAWMYRSGYNPEVSLCHPDELGWSWEPLGRYDEDAVPLVRLSDLPQKWLCKTCEGVFRADVDHEPACSPLCRYEPIHSDNFEEFTQEGGTA